MRSVFLSIVILSLFAQSMISASVGTDSDWNSVLSLSPGVRLIVQLKGGSQLKGRLRSADEGTLSIETGGRSTRIPKDEVHRVFLGKRGSLTKRALIGGAIGFGIGIGAGVLYERNSPDPDGLAAAGGMLYGVPVGAAIGALASGGTKKGTLIYEAP